MIVKSERVGSWWHFAFACLLLVGTNAATVRTAEAASKLERISKEASSKLKKFSRTAAYYAHGVASYYGKAFHGRRTASGEIFDMHALTAAHKTLPMNSLVRVTNLDNGLSVIVKITDRGPFHKNRLIDLSYAAAKELKMVKRGVAKVEIAPVRTADMAKKDDVPLLTPMLAALEGRTPPQLYVGLGELGSEEAARRLQAQLRDANIGPVSIKPLREEGRVHYAVRLGPLDTIADADMWMDRLAAQGLKDLSIIMDDRAPLAEPDAMLAKTRTSPLEALAQQAGNYP